MSLSACFDSSLWPSGFKRVTNVEPTFPKLPRRQMFPSFPKLSEKALRGLDLIRQRLRFHECCLSAQEAK